MKLITTTRIALATLLVTAAQYATAQNTNPTNSFDNAASTTSFVQWWGTATMTWDATQDAANDSASGSVQYSCPFVGAGGEQFMTFFTIANRWQWDGGYILDATTYTNLSFDIKVDPSSPLTPGNNYGYLEVGLVTDGWNTTYLPGYNIPPTATNWTHVDQPLSSSLANIDKVVGVFIKMWSNGAHTNTLLFNLDNIAYTQPTAPVVIPPPTVSLIPSKSGLNLLASGTGQYDRQQVRTTDSTFGWVGSPEPVTYEIHVKDAPGASRPGFQGHIFLAPNDTDASPSIDWNTTNLIWFHIEQLANGSGQLTFRYKTNRPGGNDMLFNENPAATNEAGHLIGVGTLGTITSATMNGTWKFTIANDTDITVVAADGTTTNYSITADAAALFSGAVRAYIGSQPNNLNYGGSGFVLDLIKISTPSTTLIEDDFSGGTLDALKWTKQASDAPGVFVVPTNSSYTISWTLPASGFSPEIGTNLAAGSIWKSPTSTEEIKITTNKRVLLANSELNPSAAYFRLIKRVATQLQVLLPGETNAPNTVSGKVGTPDPVSLGAGGLVAVTINAVDPTWHVVSSGSGTINLTSTDGSAIMPLDANLVNGTLQQQVLFGSTGSWTVTATNLSGTMPVATSASVVVGP
jgi:hypothetical protein